MKNQYIDVLKIEPEETTIKSSIGTLKRIEPNRMPVVQYVYGNNPLLIQNYAVTKIGLHEKDIGKKVTILFENNDVQMPVITGFLNKPDEFKDNVIYQEIDNTIDHTGNDKKYVITIENEHKVTYYLSRKVCNRDSKVILQKACLFSPLNGNENSDKKLIQCN